VGFVVDKPAMGQVFSEYFSFPCPYIPPTDPHSSQSIIRGQYKKKKAKQWLKKTKKQLN
jgi:hypothetical protein